MHKLFTTEGIVLLKRGLGEANTRVALLTEELGLVHASARAGRLQRSKLRYGLESLTEGRFTLLRGKHEWKLTGTEKISRPYTGASVSKRRIAGRVSRLLLRLVNGEEPMPELYRTAVEGFSCLARTEEEYAEQVECVLVLRILSHLGYLPKTPELAQFIQTDFFSLELAAEVARSRTFLIRAINESLDATGL